jgi:pimeloyl-ACP methyl ester carboxylesterase
MPPVQVVTNTHIPYPILLLHGLGQKVSVWDAQAVKFYEKDLNLSFGGILKMSGTTAVIESKYPSGFADFFTVAFSNPVDSVGAWKRELERHIANVRARTNAEKVILIGYSMGGLTSRYYLTQHLNDHHVQRLITIGSPHQGSPFAKVWKWKTTLKDAQKTANPLVGAVLGKTLEVLSAAETDVPMDAPAVRDLMRPEDGGEFTKRIAGCPHPTDVEYVSVVGKVEVLKELQQWSKSGVQEMVRRGLEAIGFGMEAAFADGDGVVSAKSQTMNELPWFQADRSRQRISQTITLSTVHEDHLHNSTEIQRVSLDAKPEFKSAELYSVERVSLERNAQTLGGQASTSQSNSGPSSMANALVLEFVDYLPPERCVLSLSVTSEGKQQQLSVQKERVRLVRKSNGSVVAQAVCPLPETIDLTKPAEFGFTVKNSFGNEFRSIKVWAGKP